MLDWAEKRPKAKNEEGILGQLQMIRKLQRDLAERDFEWTRPPDSTELNIFCVRIFEIFHYEDFDGLRRGIKSLFREIDSQQDKQNFDDFFTNFSESLMSLGCSTIGYLYRDILLLPESGANRHNRQLPDIHPLIKHVKIDMHKLLPSVILISLDIWLRDEASSVLDELQKTRYLDETTIESVYLHPLFLSFSTASPDAVRTRSVLRWLGEIRKNVEDAISPYLCGYFMSKVTSECKLPAIEIYMLKGPKKTKTGFAEWANRARHWYRSYGFNFFPGYLYGNSKLLFSWRETVRSSPYPGANRIVLFPIQKKSNNSGMLRNEFEAIRDNIPMYLSDIIRPVSLIEFLNRMMIELETIKRYVSDTTKQQATASKRLTQCVNLYQEFQLQAQVVQRLAMEFEQNSSRMQYFLRDWKELSEINVYTNHEDQKVGEIHNLAENFMERVRYLLKFLIEQMSVIDKSFSTYIESTSINANIRLQRVTAWLTFVAAILALIGLIAYWQDIASNVIHLIKFIIPPK
jgi:hypothetical protein